MPSLAQTTLSAAEQRAVERFVAALREALRERLIAVWLYGSAARPDRRPEESDVDLLVLTEAGRKDWELVHSLAWSASAAERETPIILSPRTNDLRWLEERRAIRDFFIQEVDRDKLVVYER